MSGTPVLYRLARWLGRLVLGIYFRGIEVTGRDRIPSRGPVIFAANHPQSISDALVLGLASGRVLHFIGHSGLFRKRMKAWFLRQCGVIPVYRSQDVDGHAAKNVATFQACTDLLADGGSIGIFPEGTSDQERRVQRIKTGTARIALESEAAHDWRLGVRVVPVGLNFESRRRFRSRVLVSLGEPLRAAEFQSDYERDPADAVQQLTSKLESALRWLVVDLSHGDMEPLARDVVHTYGADLLERPGLGLEGRTRFQREQELERHVARALDHFLDRAPEQVRMVRDGVVRYHRVLDRLRLSDDVVRQQKDPSVRKQTIRLLLLAAIGLPVGIYGVGLNWTPYKLTGKLAALLRPDPTKIHFHQLWIGTLIFLAYYPTLLFGFHRIWGGPWWQTLVFAATLLPTGLFGRWYVRTLIRERRRFRFAWMVARHRIDLQTMRQHRNQLVQQLDVLLEEYLSVQRSRIRAAGQPPSHESEPPGPPADEGTVTP